MNAKTELLEYFTHVKKTVDDIEWMEVLIDNRMPSIANKLIKDVAELDFEYDNGYGTQYIHGYVVFKDSSWFERGEYDGSEWWEYKRLPLKGQIAKEVLF